MERSKANESNVVNEENNVGRAHLLLSGHSEMECEARRSKKREGSILARAAKEKKSKPPFPIIYNK
jgi:hypothetical protein